MRAQTCAVDERRRGGPDCLIAAQYRFMDVFWLMVFFWGSTWTVGTVWIDVLRRHDIGGFANALS